MSVEFSFPAQLSDGGPGGLRFFVSTRRRRGERTADPLRRDPAALSLDGGRDLRGLRLRRRWSGDAGGGLFETKRGPGDGLCRAQRCVRPRRIRAAHGLPAADRP